MSSRTDKNLCPLCMQKLTLKLKKEMLTREIVAFCNMSKDSVTSSDEGRCVVCPDDRIDGLELPIKRYTFSISFILEACTASFCLCLSLLTLSSSCLHVFISVSLRLVLEDVNSIPSSATVLSPQHPDTFLSTCQLSGLGF